LPRTFDTLGVMAITHPVLKALEDANRTQADLARFMGVDPSTINHKLSGKRGWDVEDVNLVLGFFRSIGFKRVTFERLFGADRKAA
jgi:hypothetical protein